MLNLRDFGVIKRLDGTKQSTWRGMLLVYSTADKLPGDTLGEGNGWSLVQLAPAVPIALFGNMTVAGQTGVQNQTPNQVNTTPATMVITVTRTQIPTRTPPTQVVVTTMPSTTPLIPVTTLVMTVPTQTITMVTTPPTTVPSVPTQPVTTVSQLPITVQSTIPVQTTIPLPL